MSVFSKVRGFFGRHRGKFFVGGVLVAGSVLLTRYAQQKLKDWQERETREFLERTRKQQHFESTERTCNQTVLSLLGTLNEALAKVVDTDSIVADLRGNPENKVELWEQLKILVLTKACCLIYISAMLVLTLRIQLNIVGGYLFQDPNSVTTGMQQQYLLLCNNLLDGGLVHLADLIKTEMTKVMKPIDLKKQIKLRDFDNIFWTIESTISQDLQNPVEKMIEYVLKDGVPDGRGVYNNMVRDTADLLESDEVKTLASHCVNRGFSMLADQLAEYYMPSVQKIKEVSANTPTNGFVHPSDVEIPLAKLIPIVNGLISKGQLPNQIVTQLIVNDRVKTFGANLYECFSHAR